MFYLFQHNSQFFLLPIILKNYASITYGGVSKDRLDHELANLPPEESVVEVLDQWLRMP